MAVMGFEWDEAKRQGNLDKHGLDFRLARRLFDGRPIVTTRSSYREEDRFLTTGAIDDLFVTAVWTRRGEAIRLISLRRARDAERRAHRSLHGG
jgi:uncharacterized DUF497 family protein